MSQTDTGNEKACHLASWTPDATVAAGGGVSGMYDIGSSRCNFVEINEALTPEDIMRSERGVAFLNDNDAPSLAEVQLRAIDRMVLFYGEDDRRAWLLDGRSALLHMAKASLLHHVQPGRIKNPDIRNKIAQMHLPGGDLAYRTFQDRAKMQLVLEGNEDEGQSTVAKIVIEHWNALVDTGHVTGRIARLASVGAQLVNNVNAKDLPQLVGFDYNSVVLSGCEVVRARQVALQSNAAKWLDLVHARSSAILLGNSFGDMITPTWQPMATNPSQSVCPRTQPMPTGKDYLAIPHYVLSRFARRFAQTGNLTLQIESGLHIKFETNVTADCTCRSGRECPILATMVDEADSKLGNAQEIKDMLKKYPDGAVIVGD